MKSKTRVKRLAIYFVIVVVAAGLCGGAAFLYAKGIPSVYKTDCMMSYPESPGALVDIVNSAESRHKTFENLNIKNEKDYSIAVKNNNASTMVLITVSGPGAQTVADIGNELMRVSYEKASKVLDPSKIATIDEAPVPSSPSSSERNSIVMKAILAGLFFSICLVIIINTITNRGQTSEKLEKLLHIPVLLDYSQDEQKLKECVEYASIDKPIRNLVFLSATQQEKSSDVALSLVKQFALAGCSTLFVKPSSGTDGLYAFVSNQSDLQHVCKPTSQALLSELSLETDVSNWGAVFASQSFTETLEDQLKPAFERIVFDAPAFSPVPHALPLVNACDATIIVVGKRQADTALLKKMVDSIREADANILGIVLTK